MSLAPDARVYIAGHRGMVGSAVVRRLASAGYRNIVTASSADLDLRDQAATFRFFDEKRPDVVVLAAAKVGGILANRDYPAQFLYDNLAIASNVVEAARRTGVRKLLNLGSSCIYPRLAPQPISEDRLLSGPLEETNRAYALAKIAAIELCDSYRFQYRCDFISAMPCNLYGPGDNYDLHGSHVIPALMRKAHTARLSGVDSFQVWGTGNVRREFLHVDDLADACLFLLTNFSGAGPINVGTGADVTIRELAELVCEVVGYRGAMEFDSTKPDGTPRKLLDVSMLTEMGWTAKTGLRTGLQDAYRWFCDHESTARGVACVGSATK